MFKRFLMIAVAVALPLAAAAQESPLAVVAHVLSLSDEQIHALASALESRNEALRPVVQQLQALQQTLGAQLQSPNPDAETIGKLVIQIRGLETQIQSALAASNKDIEQLLTPEQQQRIEQIRGAAPVCEIVPAFKAVGLM